MVREIEADEILFEPQFLGRWIVRHRCGLGSKAEISGCISRIRWGCHQIEQVALTAVPILRPGGGPVEKQIQISHQLGPVAVGLKSIHGPAVNQRLKTTTIQHRRWNPVTQISEALERTIRLA